jgi:ATP-binding cassette subfamily B protein
MSVCRVNIPVAALAVVAPRARGESRALAASAALGALGVVLDLARPWPLALAVDHAIVGDRLFGLAPGALLVVAALSLVLVTAGAGLVDMAAIVAAERAAERVGARMREDVFGTALTLSLRWHDRTRSGELISRITTDVGRLLDALVAVWSTMLPDAVRLSMVLAVLFAINPVLALIGVAAIPVLAALAVRQRRRVRSAQQDARVESGRFTATAVDLLRNVRAVQAFGRADGASSVFRARNRSMLDVNLRAVTTEARWAPRADIVLAAGAGLVLVVGGNQVLGGAMSTGDLLVVMSYVSALYSPVRGLSRLSGVLAKASASAARVQEVLHCDERVCDHPHAVAAPHVRHSVRFSGVWFGYGDGHRVLDGFDLTVAAGETVALVGPSGSGKTTLLHLLLRLYDVDDGAVLLDGIDVRDMSVTSLRRRIAFVPQDPWLFDASIVDNIAFGTPHATWHAVLAASRSALVDEFIGRMPDGYHTVVGEGAARLSGGQRRRIALARAAISDASVLLLDEPTASLDRASADHVIDAIRRTSTDRTVLLVTHDHDLASIADRVVVLDRPSAAAFGAVSEPTLAGRR